MAKRYNQFKTTDWIRTCQECGHHQVMVSPENQKSDNWRDAETKQSFNTERGLTGKDCVIVALANYAGKSYETVLADCYLHISTDAMTENHTRNGFRSATYIAVYEKYIGRKAKQVTSIKSSLITGLVRMSRPNRKTGHLVMAILGMIHDVDGSETPISEYRKRTGMSVKEVWL